MSGTDKTSPERRQAAISRVIVSTAGAPGRAALIEIAAALAGALRAPMTGVHVREDWLRDLANLPFTRALSPGGNEPHALSSELIEQAWASEESRFRRALSQTAASAKIKYSFETAKGSIETYIKTSARLDDLVALAAETSGPSTHSLSDMLEQIAGSARAVLVVGNTHTKWGAGPVVVVTDGIAQSRAPIALAVQIAKAVSRPLVVLSLEERVTLDEIAELTGDVPHNTITVGTNGMTELIAAVRGIDPGLVVAPLGTVPFDTDAAIRTLLRTARVPVLFAGPPAPESPPAQSTA